MVTLTGPALRARRAPGPESSRVPRAAVPFWSRLSWRSPPGPALHLPRRSLLVPHPLPLSPSVPRAQSC